jgi:hypothetical protein
MHQQVAADGPHHGQHRPGEAGGARRRFHALAGLDEQRVVEKVAQALEGVAHGALRHAQFVGGARHALLADQDVEHGDQVEVQRSFMHNFHNVYVVCSIYT